LQKAKDGSDLAWFWWIGSVGSRSNGGRRLGSAGGRRLGLVARLQAQGSSWRLGAGSVVARGGASGAGSPETIENSAPGTVRGRGNSGEVACVMRRPMETSTSVRRAGKVVRHGARRSGNSGEQTPVEQSEGERAKGLARILTTMRSSRAAQARRGSGGTAASRRAPSSQQWRRLRLGFRKRRRWLRVWFQGPRGSAIYRQE